jgi:DNA-binding winged helix-turn-helix (wHTH) protein/Tol biopolymer transport system component
VLVYLIERHGRLVSKRELTDAVWPDTAVMDNSLAQCLVEIRRALADESQQLIRTVARRGYVFTASVERGAAEFHRLPAGANAQHGPVLPSSTARAAGPQKRHVILNALAVLIAIAATLAAVWSIRDPDQPLAYTQLTSFTDAVVSPALSPDGKLLAFIRSDDWFMTPGEIYVKLLPDGEPVQVTNDSRPKYGLAFSPDGSRISYTTAAPPWESYVVSPLGGTPTLLLSNSSGVTWLGERRILFSEVSPRAGVHMGVVTAMEDRSEHRRIYFPQDERGMVHLAYASPDRKWILVLEMNPVWQPCRVVPSDGTSPGRQVGPKGSCTSAAWSPDGRWMYFGVDVNGERHLWRQHFPDGQPEQITFGPTEEAGIAIAGDGQSLITSIGMRQSALWMHDARGHRPLSSEGYIPYLESTGLAGTSPVFSRNGKWLFYLRSESPVASAQLWRTEVTSERSEKILPGIFMTEFDLSDDGDEVLYTTQAAGKPSQLWIARVDRRSAPQLIPGADGDAPHFGRDGRIVYRSFDGTRNYLMQINRDGSGRSHVFSHPVGNIFSISPDRRWIAGAGTIAGLGGGTFAMPLGGGAPRRVCSGCPVTWAPDGRFLYLAAKKPSLTDPGRTRVIPLREGEMLPPESALGVIDLDDPDVFPGSYMVDAFEISLSPDPAVYAYVKTGMHRNLFRIPLP